MDSKLTIPKKGDIAITCFRCHASFDWTIGEQEFYFERGLDKPKYCKPCRAERKREYQEKGNTYANRGYNQGRTYDGGNKRSE